MIIRERSNDFIMIEQDYHAKISGKLITNWKNSLFRGQNLRKSVEYAILKHDYGWKLIDKQPFWNDEKQAPYSFVDFPTPPKTIFYKHGIDEVVLVDPYAGLLCSKHYTSFLLNDNTQESRLFVQREEKRKEDLIRSLPNYDEGLFNFHYGLLQLCDNLSLYICLNEPGAAKDDEHPFFRNGIPVSESFDMFNQHKIHPRWKDENTIQIDKFPFDGPIKITLKQKSLAKETISIYGLMNSYHEAPFVDVDINLEPE